MNLEEYQKLAAETAIYGDHNAINYPVLGLTSEAGEIAGKWKKVLRDDKGVLSDEKKKELSKEVGDVLWYCAALCRDLGVSLADVAQQNIDKLMDRKKRSVLGGSGDNR